MYRLFGAVRDFGGAITTAIPFLFAADHFGRQLAGVRRIRAGWTATPLTPTRDRLALFSDSIAHTDGVARSCARFVTQAEAAGRVVLVPQCGEPSADDPPSYRRVPRVRTIRSRLYPSLAFEVPSLLGTIDWLWRERITRVELATPGPMGLMGLIAARLLRVPVTASYHTEVPSLLYALTGSSFVRTAVRHYLHWFYAAVDRVFAFSDGSRRRLVELGVPADKIDVVPVAVDPSEFAPSCHDRSIFAAVGAPVGDRPVVLSVGRLSPEKNIATMIDAVASLQHLEHPPALVIVGDGPDRERLIAHAAGSTWVRFVGEQRGEILQRLYASASVFAFASRIDTLGLVALEAMASGLPVVVPSDANIAALVTGAGVGECYAFGVEGLAAAIAHVLSDQDRAARLGHNARVAMVQRWSQARFDHHWRVMTAS
jgi:glycosyltransferase involved in cell wall biosynthesis